MRPDVDAPGATPAEIERLFREHNAALLRFVTAKLGSQHEAREVAQEAYVRLRASTVPKLSGQRSSWRLPTGQSPNGGFGRAPAARDRQ